MDYITHKREDGYQRLADHLQGVSVLAEGFADSFGAAAHAARTGLLHDIGKYSAAAQRRQLDPEHTARVDHSTAGAQAAANEYKDLCAAFAIAGHHGGLPDCGSRASLEDGTLRARLQKPLKGEDDASAWRGEIAPQAGSLLPTWLKGGRKESDAFSCAMYTRMLFSCLVDADYLDTEAFMQKGSVRRGTSVSMETLLKRLRDYTAPWLESDKDGINRARNEILARCLDGGQWEKGLYSLTVPTGGGKTVSSLAFALTHAAAHRMKRVIYVIPYTSIIEQNAQVFRSILGQENVLEHHANVDFEDAEQSRMRLAAENWDAPVIVTTAVQFFESLFASKTSRCRKLHNLADAVIILDEAQMLPIPYLRPCVDAIAELVQNYGVTAVMCTATQPALGDLIRAYAPQRMCREIMENPGQLYNTFRRVCFAREGVMQTETLARRLSEEKQVLCIVNSRKKAGEVYDDMAAEGRFYLSTLMTAEHRSRTIAQIRQRLAQGLACRVCSTSLIEAGVDLDFPTVWREQNGLDSILQAAGRCNREGKRSAQQSVVHIFRFEGAPPAMFAQNIYAMDKTAEDYADIASPEAIEAYFNTLMFVAGAKALDAKDIVSECCKLNFAQVGRTFRMIEEDTVPVYIPTEDNAELLQQLREGNIGRDGLRRLGRSAVNVYRSHFEKLRIYLECPMGDAFGILADEHQYDADSGLQLEPRCAQMWFA